MIKVCPTLVILPVLQIPIVNGIFLSITTNVASKLFIEMPYYVAKKTAFAVYNRVMSYRVEPNSDLGYDNVDNVCYSLEDLAFPEMRDNDDNGTTTETLKDGTHDIVI